MTLTPELAELAAQWEAHFTSPAFTAACAEIAALQRQGVDLSEGLIADRLGIPVELLMALAAQVAEAITGTKFAVIEVPAQGKPN